MSDYFTGILTGPESIISQSTGYDVSRGLDIDLGKKDCEGIDGISECLSKSWGGYKDITLWLYLAIAAIASIYRYAVQVNEFQSGSFFNKLIRPKIMINNQVFSWIWVILIFGNAYASYRLVNTVKDDSTASLINTLFSLEIMHVIVWTVTFFDNRSIYSAFFVGLVVLLGAIIQFRLSIKVDCISTIIYGLFVIWAAYTAIINLRYLKLNPELEDFPVFPDIINGPTST